MRSPAGAACRIRRPKVPVPLDLGRFAIAGWGHQMARRRHSDEDMLSLPHETELKLADGGGVQTACRAVGVTMRPSATGAGASARIRLPAAAQVDIPPCPPRPALRAGGSRRCTRCPASRRGPGGCAGAGVRSTGAGSVQCRPGRLEGAIGGRRPSVTLQSKEHQPAQTQCGCAAGLFKTGPSGGRCYALSLSSWSAMPFLVAQTLSSGGTGSS